MRVYKAAFELASVPLELWVRRLVWLCTDGANVMTGPPMDWRPGWRRIPTPSSCGCEASNDEASQQSVASDAAFSFCVV